MYQVVEAQGRPSRVGGQPSHRERSGDSGWSQEDSPLTPGDVRARQQNTSTNIVIVNWGDIGDNETCFVLIYASFVQIKEYVLILTF